MTSSLVKAAPPSEGLKHPQNGAAVCYLEDPPGVGSTRGEGTLGAGGAPPRAGLPAREPSPDGILVRLQVEGPQARPVGLHQRALAAQHDLDQLEDRVA